MKLAEIIFARPIQATHENLLKPLKRSMALTHASLFPYWKANERLLKEH